MDVSSSELTALDFFTYADKFGINRIVSVLQELSQNIKPTALAKTAKQYTNTAAVQRLGYILDGVLSEEKLSQALWKVLNERKILPHSTFISKREKRRD